VTDQLPDAIDTKSPNVARIYDYMLGGKDNFPADREAAEQILAAFPESREGVRENRAFLRRAVEYLTGQVGIRQFLDIGTGLPTQQNVHEVAQGIAPDARVVYVDNDRVVCAHGRALLAGNPNVSMVQGDLRRPEEILTERHTRALLDFTEPAAVLIVATLHFIPDHEDPFGAVDRLRDALAPGSFLIISHLLDAEHRRSDAAQVKNVYARSNSGVTPRSLDDIMRFFGDFEMLDHSLFARPELVERFSGIGWSGVGRKP
jgi:hypothetical protein